jgi:asparagine synthase (glutamine-hydrolysing)
MIFMNRRDKEELYAPELRACLNGNIPERVLAGYFAKSVRAEPLAQQQYVDVKTYLVEDILTKVDRMSMAVSLETRVPLLDYRIVEFALNIPDELKLHRGQTKRILKQAMSQRLPDAILNKPKQGFSIPLKHWLRGPLKPMMMDLLSSATVKQRGYFKPETVTKWIYEHLERRANHSHRLWALMVFELWHRQVLETHSVQEALYR